MRFKGFIDSTFREGQQSPLLFDTFKYRFSLEDKKVILKALVDLGVTSFEFFSPIVNSREAYDLAALIDTKQSLALNKEIRFLIHCRCHPDDIKQALKFKVDGLNLYMGINNWRARYSRFKSLSELIDYITKTVETTRRLYPGIYLRFSIEDTFRTPLTKIYQIYDRISSFVDGLGLPDTTGMSLPDQVRIRVRSLRRRYPKVDLESHFHNDRGMALANSLVAIEEGIDWLDTTIWGLGERSGITSLTGILFNLYHFNRNLISKYNIALSYPLNVIMAAILKMQVPYNEPVSLTNRTHIAGIHQQAVLRSNRVYEAGELGRFGVNKLAFLLGPLTGWHLVYYYLKEIRNYQTTRDQARQVVRLFKKELSKYQEDKQPEDIL